MKAVDSWFARRAGAHLFPTGLLALVAAASLGCGASDAGPSDGDGSDGGVAGGRTSAGGDGVDGRTGSDGAETTDASAGGGGDDGGSTPDASATSADAGAGHDGSAAACTPGGIPGAAGPGATTFQAPPTLPTHAANTAGNACSASLPADWGTNFPYPADPYAPTTDGGVAVKNQSIIGWEGNYYAPFAYLSGSFFARGVNGTFTQGASSFCGTMFSFGIYGSSGAHAPGSVQWTMADGYLPALTTSFNSGSIAVSITNFADSVSIGGSSLVVVYSRVSITNNGVSTATVSPEPSQGLVALTTVSNDVPAAQTVDHDYIVAVDDFGSGQPLPT